MRQIPHLSISVQVLLLLSGSQFSARVRLTSLCSRYEGGDRQQTNRNFQMSYEAIVRHEKDRVGGVNTVGVSAVIQQ